MITHENLRIKGEPSEIKFNDDILKLLMSKKKQSNNLFMNMKKKLLNFLPMAIKCAKFVEYVEFGNKVVLNIHTSIVHPKEENNDILRMWKILICTNILFVLMEQRRDITWKNESLRKHIEALHGGKKKYDHTNLKNNFENP